MGNTFKTPQKVIDLIIKWDEEWKVYDSNPRKHRKPKSADYMIKYITDNYKYTIAGNSEIEHITNRHNLKQGYEIR